MHAPVAPPAFGRFNVLRVIGEGAQGTVFLAEDSHLERKVAIKTIQFGCVPERRDEIRLLLDEARIVSKLQHPHIVMLYDAATENGMPYLVFEYVEGETLADLLHRQDALPVAQAVDLACSILDGIAYAHMKGVIHRDLKPANILLDTHGVPRIMDFGIAKRAAGNRDDEALIGTPRYMAPEYLSQGTIGPQGDLFSLGLVLYEMLTGKPAVTGRSLEEALDVIVNGAVTPPSRINAAVDEKLDGIVLKALAKDPGERYRDAVEMKLALESCLSPAAAEAATSGREPKQSILEFMLRRIRHKSDFPALSQAISTINRVASSDDQGASDLANVILKDFALTNKLLRLVNTAYYGQFGGTISTISRAVVILGFESIRNVAITLLLIEHLQNKAQAAQLKDEIAAAFMSGIIARAITPGAGLKDGEEAFICSVFHNLGRLLTTYYFHDETGEIRTLIQQRRIGEADASRIVLGVSFEELGVAVARAWNFPDKIVSSMRRVSEAKVKKPETETEKLRVVASLANELCELAATTPLEHKQANLARLMQRYCSGVTFPGQEALQSVIESSVGELRKDSVIISASTMQSALIRKIARWSGADTAEARITLDLGRPEVSITPGEPLRLEPLSAALDENADSGAILAAGIQDISNTLVEHFKLDDVLRMILETMYRGMGFSHVLLCVKDSKLNTMDGRFGFGPDIESLIRGFRFPLNNTMDAFQAAMSQGADILISDSEAENIRHHIPEWFRALALPRSFILFPLLADKKPIALFYADKDVPGGLAIRPNELTLLKTLRNQAVLAIKQKH